MLSLSISNFLLNSPFCSSPILKSPSSSSLLLSSTTTFGLKQNQKSPIKKLLKLRLRLNSCLKRAVVDEESSKSATFPKGSSEIFSACFVGLLTGVSVVLFNYGVHEIRDFFGDEIPNRGTSWFREKPIEDIWKRIILVPVTGGLIVSMLKLLLEDLENSREESTSILGQNLKAALRPFLKAIAACITLGTGNSLGPEGPSVEIGASIGKGYGALFDKSAKKKVSLVAAGSAAGIASGFNAAVAGCFFAIESVLWPSPNNSSMSQSNTTSMVILSAVIASVVSEIGLGSQPAFKVPEYDFRSPSELPLYLLLGLLCGLVSLTLTRCTSYLLIAAEKIHKSTKIPKAVYPIFGSLVTGLIALAYPEILYRGFENVDIMLESRPFVSGLSTDVLVQLVAAKIVATSFCRAFGLVGGYYAPSLFIGAATGMAYGKFIGFAISQANPILHLSVLDVASPQAYGLVGMAATLAGVCQVPLTSVLLLFELTQDYRIVLPLLGAVGLSSWITSGKTTSGKTKEVNSEDNKNTKLQTNQPSTKKSGVSSKNSSDESDLCKLESSRCLDDSDIETNEVETMILVSESMITNYVTVLMHTSISEAITLMFEEKQSCSMIIDNDNSLIGLITLEDIQEFSKSVKAKNRKPGELSVYDLCSSNSKSRQVSCTATPSMSLYSAQMIMKKHGVNQLPVVSDNAEQLVGLLDKECIDFACNLALTRELLS